MAKLKMMAGKTTGSFLEGSQWTAMTLLVGGLLLAALALWSYLQLNERDAVNTRHALDAAARRAHIPPLVQALRAAGQGEREELERLRTQRDRFDKDFADLITPDATAGRDLVEHAAQAQTAWLALNAKVERVLSASVELVTLRQRLTTLDGLLSELYKTMKQAGTRSVADGVSASLALQAGLQAARLERMSAALTRWLDGGAASQQAIADFTTSRDEFAATLGTLADQSRARSALDETARLLTMLRSSSDDVLEKTQALQAIINQAPEVNTTSSQLDTALEALVVDYRSAGQFVLLLGMTLGANAVLLFSAFALLCFALLILLTLRAARQREEQSRAQTVRDEGAILRLLDEMGDLANGDLTVEATVTEEKTGAIADAINYAIEALRSLVTTINVTASRVSKSTQDSRAIALRLAEASGLQAQQITQASAAVQSLTIQIDEVARNAGESAEVASRSVEVAGRGAQTVRDTITGMDAIREQIQETAKRIKRLGDSSLEIGKSVELIDDIADQTNILALNAAMQAAMAGEAGRGFAVVADEVQRLAENSRDATKKIEVLVRTIQADTSEAVSSMEVSIAGVVEGANLAENAGEALREIENVSAYIADLTKRIADSAQRQSRQSAEINDTVQAIRAITEENTEGTRRAADSVEELAKLSNELQRSVAGFRLP
ncbi:chemotaxis protein [Chromatium okenii]|uniref:methyl-accepting chemotaxis protein n=1 Tax=Chromatium okenii TaxID=61644 RepID=UPI0019033482|nr:methyl-accepting chemotaxis protein [Chromatium okenii]MBK1641366.1 chemotaxis protein [Chromatium okenii]